MRETTAHAVAVEIPDHSRSERFISAGALVATVERVDAVALELREPFPENGVLERVMGVARLRGIHRSAARHHQHRRERALGGEIVACVFAPAAPDQYVLRAVDMVAVAIPAAAVVLGTGDGAIEKSNSRRGLGVKPETRDVVRPDIVRPAIAHALEVRGRPLWVACPLVNVVSES